MNDLESFFRRNTGRLIHKWVHYFEIYDRHLARYRNRPVNILEFGISQGGSLTMWGDYFGRDAKLFGVDINPECRRFEEGGVRIFIGDQADRTFLRWLANELPTIDILIDDGGHTMTQQIATFEELFGKIAPDGVYLCEDVHTSYWHRWGGGVRKRGSFVEYAKGWVDDLHAWHSKQPRKLTVGDFTRSVHSVHFYDSVVVVEKRPMQPPHDERTGQAQFPDWVAPPSGPVERLQRRLRAARGKAR